MIRANKATTDSTQNLSMAGSEKQALWRKRSNLTKKDTKEGKITYLTSKGEPPRNNRISELTRGKSSFLEFYKEIWVWKKRLNSRLSKKSKPQLTRGSTMRAELMLSNSLQKWLQFWMRTKVPDTNQWLLLLTNVQNKSRIRKIDSQTHKGSKNCQGLRLLNLDSLSTTTVDLRWKMILAKFTNSWTLRLIHKTNTSLRKQEALSLMFISLFLFTLEV